MSPAHTPGPCSTPDNNLPWTVFYAASAGQWQIWKGGVLICTANTEANARLIAAVPELRAALEWAETLLEGRLQPQNIIRTAIAKAKGGAS